MANIGLADHGDAGRQAVTGQEEDRGVFKIPNLRNVMLTAPYMHDGRFQSLEEVLDHYAHGVNDNPNLDPRLRGPNGAVNRFDISPYDRDRLIDFLGTLTDPVFPTDPRFSDPFVTP
ncbi:hypothetical protein KFE98_14260 [bacterium SCSIO 12741]|nr:hypothetical protein KFE98_14260 [bacterium SCSIO 12741]